MPKNLDSGPEKQAWSAVAVGLFLFIALIALSRTSHSLTLVPACVSTAIALLTALISAGRMRLSRREAEEALAVAQVRPEQEGTDLFDSEDDALEVAARASRSYVRWFVPAVTVLLGIGLFLVALYFWRRWADVTALPAQHRALRYAALATGLFLAAVLAGSYFVGASREPNCRWLRPAGAWLFLTAAMLAVGILVFVGIYFEVQIPSIDARAARFLCVVLMILGVEAVLAVVVEFYRPRSPHEEERPLCESRLLSLFTEPGGIARNVAASLDYQFGFQVSEAWFYRFIERAVAPLAVLMVAGIWLQSCIVVVRADEQGIREWFGAVTNRTPLGPGLYFKLPWPFGRIYKFPVQRVQQIPIGYKPGGKGKKPEDLSPEEEAMQGDMTGRVIVWAKFHNRTETPFIVAATPPESGPKNQEELKSTEGLPVAVYFMSASIPLFFKVDNLYNYAYAHKDANKELEEIATREVVRYLAGVDFFEILTHGREKAALALKQRIQAAADARKLGIQVVFVGMQGLHPPVRVGKAFDEVVGAMETKHETTLKADSYHIRTVRGAEAQALKMKSDAMAYKENRVQVPKAEANRFLEQLVGYKNAPSVFVLRTFLDMLENDAKDTRKYVVSDKSSNEVVLFDLKEKLRPDLLDLNLEGGKSEK